MNKKTSYLLLLFIFSRYSFCFLIDPKIDPTPLDQFAQKISSPIGGQGVLIAPEWILTTNQYQNLKTIVIEDRTYSIINRQNYKDVCLLRLNRPINYSISQRYREQFFEECPVILFSNFDNNFNLSRPFISGSLQVIPLPNGNKGTFSQNTISTIQLEPRDAGRGFFIDFENELFLCGNVLSRNEGTLLNNSNNWIDYTVLSCVLEETNNNPKPQDFTVKPNSSRPQTPPNPNNNNSSPLTQVAGYGTWKYGYLLSPRTFIAPNNRDWQMNSEVFIRNERRVITDITPVQNFFLMTLDKNIEHLEDGLSYSSDNSNISDIKLNHSGLVRLYIPRNTTVNQPKLAPEVKNNELTGFTNLLLDSQTKAQANHYSLMDALSDKAPVNLPTTGPWTFIVYASDDSMGTNYTSIYYLLNALYNGVDDAPDNQVNIVIQTKIPDNTYNEINKRNNQIPSLEATVHPQVAKALKTAKGMVRFVIRKNNSQITINTQQCGQFRDSLNDLQIRKDFLNYANSLNIPGRKMYCLYAHGRGWDNIGGDGSALDVVNFADGLKDRVFDILRLDCCLSQGIETLYEITVKNPNIPYGIASQTISPLDSVNDTYARLIPVAYRSSSVLDYARQNTQDKTERDYNRAYTRLDVQNVNNGDGVTYSTIDLRLIPELKKRIDLLAQNLLNYSNQSQFNKNFVLNLLKEARNRATLFHDKDTLDFITDRNNPQPISDYSFYYDIFDVIRVFKEITSSKINDPWKSNLLNACNAVQEMQPIVILENHVSLHPFLKGAKGLSIDLSPAAKFNFENTFEGIKLSNSFDDDYKQLAFSRSGNDLAPWYRLLRLE